MSELLLDEFNRELIARVSPPDWTNPKPAVRYNLVVLGAGTAGLVSAAGAAGLGGKVALIERHRLGGDCLNYGCVPSKALLRCARAVNAAQRFEEFGVRSPGLVEVDFAAVMRRMRRLRAGISRHDSAERFRGLGVDVFLGEARFSGRDTVEVNGQTLRFARAVIATGTRAAVLDLPGMDRLRCFTNESVFGLTELPRRLVVVGAGPIGCELSQAFRRFGSEVHLVNRSPGLLGKEEPETVALLRRQFEREGIHLHLGAKIVGGEDSFVVVEEAGGTVRLPADAVLVAIGRQPNVEGMGLDLAGVEYDAQGVRVNDFLQTRNRRIYAAGDICSPYKFTHAADALARLALRNAFFSFGPFGRARASDLVVPWCTYTDPEVAHVGLTAAQADARGIEVRTFRVSLAEVDRAVLDGEADGFALIHVRKRSDRLVGATIVAAHAGEMIGVVVLAMTRKLGLSALSQTIHAYPTQAEVLKRLGDAYQKSRLTPRTAALLRTILRWR